MYCRAIVRATDELKRNAKLISPHTNNIGYAVAIFEPAPLKSSGTTLGVTVQLLTTFLYMANYNLVIPTVDNFMDHLQACPPPAVHIWAIVLQYIEQFRIFYLFSRCMPQQFFAIAHPCCCPPHSASIHVFTALL